MGMGADVPGGAVSVTYSLTHRAVLALLRLSLSMRTQPRPVVRLLPRQGTVAARMRASLSPCPQCGRWFNVASFSATCCTCGAAYFPKRTVEPEPRRKRWRKDEHSAGLSSRAVGLLALNEED